MDHEKMGPWAHTGKKLPNRQPGACLSSYLLKYDHNVNSLDINFQNFPFFKNKHDVYTYSTSQSFGHISSFSDFLMSLLFSTL